VRFDGNARNAATLHTCLALASASVDCAENSDVSLRPFRTKTATGLTVQLLVGIAQTAHRIAPPAPHCIASHRTASHRSAPVAADAPELSRETREETCSGTLVLPWGLIGEPNARKIYEEGRF
jgi:hypothetical protein